MKLILARGEGAEWKELLAQSRAEAHGVQGTVQLDDDGVWRFATASHRSLVPSELVGR